MPDIVVKFLAHSEREHQFITIKTELRTLITFVVNNTAPLVALKGNG